MINVFFDEKIENQREIREMIKNYTNLKKAFIDFSDLYRVTCWQTETGKNIFIGAKR